MPWISVFLAAKKVDDGRRTLGCCHKNRGPFVVTKSHFTGTLTQNRHMKIAHNQCEIVFNCVNNVLITQNSQNKFFFPVRPDLQSADSQVHSFARVYTIIESNQKSEEKIVLYVETFLYFY